MSLAVPQLPQVFGSGNGSIFLLPQLSARSTPKFNGQGTAFINSQDRFFNVKDFGAVGDGVANDTAAIQATINACNAAGGGIVLLPAGTYLVTSTLTTPGPNIHIEGDGCNSTIILFQPATAQPCFIIGANSETGSHYEGLALRRFGINGFGAPSGSVGLKLLGATNFINEDLFIQGFKQGASGIGIWLAGANWVYTFHKCRVNDSTIGVLINDVNKDTSEGNAGRFVGGQYGQGCANAIVIGDVTSTTNRSVQVCYGLIFDGVEVEGTTSTAVIVAEGDTVNFENCWMEANIGDYQIGTGLGAYPTNVQIKGGRTSQSHGAATTSVVVQDCDRLIISGVEFAFSGVNKTGIQVVSSSHSYGFIFDRNIFPNSGANYLLAAGFTGAVFDTYGDVTGYTFRGQMQLNALTSGYQKQFFVMEALDGTRLADYGANINLYQQLGATFDPFVIYALGDNSTKLVRFNTAGKLFGQDASLAAVAANSLVLSGNASIGSLTIGGVALNSSIVPESGNLYYTDARARAALSQGSGITYNSSTGAIANAGVTSITGTANQVIVSASTGALTLSLPQNLGTSSSVQFGPLTVNSNTLTTYFASSGGGAFAKHSFSLNNASSTQVEYANIRGQLRVATAGSESGGLIMSVMNAGSSVDAMLINGQNNRVGLFTLAPFSELDVFGAAGPTLTFSENTISVGATHRQVADFFASFSTATEGSQKGQLIGNVYAGTTAKPWVNVSTDGTIPIAALCPSGGNLGFGTLTQFGGGSGVLAIANAGTNPSSNPTGGGILYCDSGALKYRGSSGTVTTLANA